MRRQPLSLQRLEELSQRLLMPQAEIIQRFIEDILGRVLIDGVIGEMHVEIIPILLTNRLVLLRCEPHQALIVDIQP